MIYTQIGISRSDVISRVYGFIVDSFIFLRTMLISINLCFIINEKFYYTDSRLAENVIKWPIYVHMALKF